MPLNFPVGPAVDDLYTFGSRTWKWNGNGWESVTTTYGPTGPTGPTGPSGGPTGPTGATGPGADFHVFMLMGA